MLLLLLVLKTLFLGKLIVKMISRSLITTQGSLLRPGQPKNLFFCLKQDPYSNYLWKSLKKGTSTRQVKTLDIFKTRFISK